jgi:hypothetical protein
MEKETHYAKAKWAEKLGVSASGYYTWRQEREERQKAQTALEDRVIALFEEGEGTYGAARICGIFRRDGEPASVQGNSAYYASERPEILPSHPQTAFTDR